MNTSLFQSLDRYSSLGRPFIFTVDFLCQSGDIFFVDETLPSGWWIDFPDFKTPNPDIDVREDFYFSSFPEDFSSYVCGFDYVQSQLQAGNSYLTNYTRSTLLDTDLSLEEIYNLGTAKYRACTPHFVFFSPETFVEVNQGCIRTHPMKGTIDAHLPGAREQLLNSKKERAEHYTVVDLLRNDLSRVADEVRVDHFQRIDYLRTRQRDLFAMSSEISGELREPLRGNLGKLFHQLLPAGSILGAPKPKTLEIILEAERYNRNFYTGIMGWYDGHEKLDTCVMIRFIEKTENGLVFKSGGGITHLSNAQEEYQEMLNKIYVPASGKP